MSASATSVSAVSAEAPPRIPPISGKPVRKVPAGKTVKLPGTLFENIPWRDLSVPLGVLGIVLFMITPVPALLLDLLISANITLSVILLLVSIYIARPVDFSVFPTALLLMTLFRLALNISSSRLILLHGNSGTAAAGGVIEAFGNFVVGGNYIIGLVIFLVLIAIQYVVINHGAVRISEVTARFTLDALPGKQMSIDSDLNAGLIDEAEARQRRKQLSAEAEFFGAMDGASRFTQRDAVASIIITIINILAGFLIGVLQHGMELRRAIETYTILTIGDGLVTVIPALMISVCGAMIITRAGSENRLGNDFEKQIFGAAEPLLLAGGVLGAMALFPGLPTIPFLALGAGTGAVGWRLRQKGQTDAAAPEAEAPAPQRENLESLLRVEPLSVEVGLGLVRLVEGGVNSPLLRRIAGIRRQLATDLGYLVPAVRVTDNLNLRAREYTISLKGVEIGRFELPTGMDMAIPTSRDCPKLEGVPTREPAFGIAAFWISSTSAEQARSAGYTVVDGVSVLGTHLAETIREYAHELYSRQDAKRLLDRVAEENPKVVEDLVPKLLPLATVQRVLQNLLRERVSIRDAVSILESLGEAGSVTRNPVLLTEYVRQSIRRMVVRPYLSSNNELHACLIDPGIEAVIESAIEHTETNSAINLAPKRIHEIVDRIRTVIGSAEGPVIALTGSGTRFFLRQLTESALPNLTVLSHSEVPSGVKVVSQGLARLAAS
ncbi:MAG TPA: flagellar biosynthesis protein FlhA [Bryobacteraceae bacterium]|nr:flagellar biosynthesis protein FlhA [Bryobacteraceae bacterium]